MKNTPKPTPIDLDMLRAVSGGTQDVSPTGMAPPKYSAGWWDFVRSKGGDSAR